MVAATINSHFALICIFMNFYQWKLLISLLSIKFISFESACMESGIEVGWVDHFLSSLFDFFQMDVISNCYMISWSSKQFVIFFLWLLAFIVGWGVILGFGISKPIIIHEKLLLNGCFGCSFELVLWEDFKEIADSIRIKMNTSWIHLVDDGCILAELMD